MKYMLLVLYSLLFSKSTFSQNELGSSLYNSISLNTTKKSLTKVHLQNNNPLFLGYYSELPSSISLKITVKSKRPKKLHFEIVRRVFDSKSDSIKIAEFTLTDPVSNVHLDAVDDRRYIIIKNLDNSFKEKSEIIFEVTEKELAPFPEINLTSKTNSVFLNKYTNSSFAILQVDSSCLASLSVPIDTSKEGLNLYLEFFDSSFQRIPLINVKQNTTEREFEILLETGKYYLKTENSQNHWPTDTLTEMLSAKPINVKTTKVIPLQKPPNSIRLISDWLRESGLAQYLKIQLYRIDTSLGNSFTTSQIDSFFTSQKYKIATLRSLENIKDTTEKKKVSKIIDEDYFDDKIHYALFSSKSWYEKNNEPTYFIYLAPLLDKNRMGKFEANYFKQFNSTIWYKIFDKIRLYSNTPIEKIFIYAPVPCSGGLVYVTDLQDKTNIFRHGMECMSGGGSTLLNDFSSIDSRSSTSIRKEIRIDTKAETFLKDVIFKNPNLEFLEKDKYSFSVIVRDVKGYILKGDTKWEKIEIKCFIREGENGKYLQVETDGVYTSGIGSYPKDSQFDKSFEPLFKQNLIAFSQKFATQFKTYLFK